MSMTKLKPPYLTPFDAVILSANETNFISVDQSEFIRVYEWLYEFDKIYKTPQGETRAKYCRVEAAYLPGGATDPSYQNAPRVTGEFQVLLHGRRYSVEIPDGHDEKRFPPEDALFVRESFRDEESSPKTPPQAREAQTHTASTRAALAPVSAAAEDVAEKKADAKPCAKPVPANQNPGLQLSELEKVTGDIVPRIAEMLQSLQADSLQRNDAAYTLLLKNIQNALNTTENRLKERLQDALQTSADNTHETVKLNVDKLEECIERLESSMDALKLQIDQAIHLLQQPKEPAKSLGLPVWMWIAILTFIDIITALAIPA